MTEAEIDQKNISGALNMIEVILNEYKLISRRDLFYTVNRQLSNQFFCHQRILWKLDIEEEFPGLFSIKVNDRAVEFFKVNIEIYE